jgi:hypothetical protein
VTVMVAADARPTIRKDAAMSIAAHDRQSRHAKRLPGPNMDPPFSPRHDDSVNEQPFSYI